MYKYGFYCAERDTLILFYLSFLGTNLTFLRLPIATAPSLFCKYLQLALTMLKYKIKIRAQRLKDPSRFQAYKAEENFKEFIEPRKILEEKGFQFPPQPSVIVQTIQVTVAKRGWLDFCQHLSDPVLAIVKEFYANLLGHNQKIILVRNSLVPRPFRPTSC